MSDMADVLSQHLTERLGVALSEPLGWIIPASVLAPVIAGIASDLDATLAAAGFGLVREAGAVALEEAADRVMGPSDVLLDAATCRWIAMELRESAVTVRGGE